MWQLDYSSESNEIEFTIPFISPTKRKHVFSPLHVAGTSGLAYPAERSVNLNYHQFSTGVLTCFVQNSLVASSTVSQQVEVFSYISAGENFNLYWPSTAWIGRETNLVHIPFTEANDAITSSAASTSVLADPYKQPNSLPSLVDDLSSNSHLSMASLLSRPHEIKNKTVSFNKTYYHIQSDTNPFFILNPFSSFFSGAAYAVVYSTGKEIPLVKIENLNQYFSCPVQDEDRYFFGKEKSFIYKFGETDDAFIDTGGNTYFWKPNQEEVAVFKFPYCNHKSLSSLILTAFSIDDQNPLIYSFFGPDSKFYFLNCTNIYNVSYPVRTSIQKVESKFDPNVYCDDDSDDN